jgi:hypothetical protein
MITILKSETADTRTCDFAKVSKPRLKASSYQHISDVQEALGWFRKQIFTAAENHDLDKITNIDDFHADFLTGFKQTGWWDNHRKITRHHLLQEDGVPKDVNLIDVLEMIADCVMAGMARSGSVYPLEISPDVLMKAFNNTADLLKSQVVVKEAI